MKRGPVNTAARAALMDRLQQGPATTTELAVASGMHKSHTHHVLNAMARRGLVERIQEHRWLGRCKGAAPAVWALVGEAEEGGLTSDKRTLDGTPPEERPTTQSNKLSPLRAKGKPVNASRGEVGSE